MVLALSVPPATITSAMPAMMVAAANWTAVAPEAQCRLTRPRHVGHPEANCDVAADHPATLQGLREEQVVEVSDGDL